MTSINLQTHFINKSTNVHLMPCKIDCNNKARISDYFHDCISGPDSDGIIKASYRGRPLQGKSISLPDGYKGVVVKEKSAACSDQQQRSLTADRMFEKMTYWNLETKPTADDAIMNSLSWLHLANVLHAPVTSLSDEED